MRIKGKKIHFIQEKRKLPNGVITQVDRIEHPGAALIIPFITKTDIVFLKQYRIVFEQEFLELPAGTLDKGEAPLSCARRELMEETGFKAGRMTKLGKICPVPGYSNEVIHLYKAEALRPAEAEKDEDEMIETVVFSRQEVRDLFNKGRICDAKTICVLCLAGWL